MMKRIVGVSVASILALAARAHGDPVALPQVGVTVELDPGWQLTAHTEAGVTLDRLTRGELEVDLVVADAGMPCADMLARNTPGVQPVTSPAYLPSGFGATAYEQQGGGLSRTDVCADEPSGNLMVFARTQGAFDAERSAALRAMLDAVEQAVRAQGNPHECASGGGFQFWLPKRRWAVATVDNGGGAAVARLEPAQPFIRVLYSVEPDGVCEAREIDGMEQTDRFHSWAIEHAWTSRENGETTVMGCGKVAGTTRVAVFDVLVDGTLDDLDDSDAIEVATNIFEGILNEHESGGGCRGDPTKYPPVSHRSHAAAAAPAPATPPDPSPPTPAPPTTSDTPAPTEVAAATPPPTDDSASSTPPAPAADTSTEASYDDDEPRTIRPTIQLAITHTAASGATGESANGAAVEVEALTFGLRGGFNSAAELGFGAGWAAGFDFDTHAGAGLAYRAGPLSIAAVAGIGWDGYGTLEEGPEIHDAGLFSYIGPRARLAIGDLMIDGSVSWADRTAHDETRWQASLSWQPRHDAGYGLGVTSVSLDNVGSATLVWVGVYPR